MRPSASSSVIENPGPTVPTSLTACAGAVAAPGTSASAAAGGESEKTPEGASSVSTPGRRNRIANATGRPSAAPSALVSRSSAVPRQEAPSRLQAAVAEQCRDPERDAGERQLVRDGSVYRGRPGAVSRYGDAVAVGITHETCRHRRLTPATFRQRSVIPPRPLTQFRISPGTVPHHPISAHIHIQADRDTVCASLTIPAGTVAHRRFRTHIHMHRRTDTVPCASFTIPTGTVTCTPAMFGHTSTCTGGTGTQLPCAPSPSPPAPSPAHRRCSDTHPHAQAEPEHSPHARPSPSPRHRPCTPRCSADVRGGGGGGAAAVSLGKAVLRTGPRGRILEQDVGTAVLRRVGPGRGAVGLGPRRPRDVDHHVGVRR